MARFNSTIRRQSTYAGMREPGEYNGAQAFIDAGEEADHFPTQLATVPVQARMPDDSLVAAPQARANVATYHSGARTVVGVNGTRHRATEPGEWRDLIHAACDAGAEPVMHGAWDGKVMAQFNVGTSNGIRNTLVLCDSFDGTTKLTCGTSSIRVGCANAIAVSMRAGNASADWAFIRHTASLEEKVRRLAEGIAEAIRSGETVRHAYDAAVATRLDHSAAQAIFDQLFPVAADGVEGRARTIADNRRRDAQQAMNLEVNNEGNTLATLWNAATYIVDRQSDGASRPVRGNAMQSMLFGTRGARIAEIQSLVEVVMADGSLQRMSVPQAREHGLDDGQCGASIIADMLGDDSN